MQQTQPTQPFTYSITKYNTYTRSSLFHKYKSLALSSCVKTGRQTHIPVDATATPGLSAAR